MHHVGILYGQQRKSLQVDLNTKIIFKPTFIGIKNEQYYYVSQVLLWWTFLNAYVGVIISVNTYMCGGCRYLRSDTKRMWSTCLSQVDTADDASTGVETPTS